MSLFRDLVLQGKVRRFFTAAIESDHLAHAYIFHGSPGCGKEAFALELAQAINCTSDSVKPCYECANCKRIRQFSHPDLHFVFPMPKDYDTQKINQYYKARAKNPYMYIEIEGHLNISVDVIRELKNEAKYAPHEAKKRFFIISGADKFSRETSNTFLKLLEEPPATLMIILITDQYHLLLDTIKSRCQPVYFPKFTEQEIMKLIKKYSVHQNKPAEEIQTAVTLAKHNLKKIFEYLERDYGEWLDWVYQFLAASTAFNISQISDLIDKVSNRKKKNTISELLDLVIVWLMDAYHYQIFKNTMDITFQEYSDNIKKFAGITSQVNYENCIALVETARDNINHNAQIPLQLTTLAIQLNEIITKARHLSREAV